MNSAVPTEGKHQVECRTKQWQISKIYREFNSLDLEPDYQRAAAVWPVEKQQLLIDSLFSGFDVPKVYLHDRGAGHDRRFAVVDGKQRLSTIVSFIDDNFVIAGGENDGKRYSELDGDLREVFREIALDAVIIEESSSLEIEDLFYRLNNGEPLNAAEMRNALGGKMAVLIRKVAASDFFANYVTIEDDRYTYRDLAAVLLSAEDHARRGSNPIATFQKRQLDQFVRENREMDDRVVIQLEKLVDTQFKRMKQVFAPSDALLSKPGLLIQNYLTVRHLFSEYRAPKLANRIRGSLVDLERRREENQRLPEDLRDLTLLEYANAVSNASRSKTSLERRVDMLVRNFLLLNPDVVSTSEPRYFTKNQRWVLWRLAGGRCQADSCTKELPTSDDGEADHVVAYSKGGKTSIENGQFLCKSCNGAKSAS